ncbi:MAG: NAD(P)-binding domain-containing protein [Bacteroidales bacterium]|nr:NAD(P)-binding domain-containing protein [Bacteroidales bacterium]
MELLIENIIIYGSAALLCCLAIILYFRRVRRQSGIVEEKIRKAKALGTHEPVSLHPHIDVNSCISTGACIAACPEKDILGIVNGKATLINASQCIGHGACFHACPTEAITLRIGTEQRGVELPHVDQNFQTNVAGIYIAGELGGMGLIRNAVEQGRQAVISISGNMPENHQAEYDLIIVGAGPAGISASLEARKSGLKSLLLEQDTLGGTVYTFPRKKVVMTSPMELPLHGRVRLFNTSKGELLELWVNVLHKNKIEIRENTKVDAIESMKTMFSVITSGGHTLTAARVLLAIGRRGTPRKLGVPGETMEKVAYRLLEPEEIEGRNILVVGGGDSAVEAALMLAGNNKVTLAHRSESFARIKVLNREKLDEAVRNKTITVLLSTSVKEIEHAVVWLINSKEGQPFSIPNDLVYIFAGGELPISFLENSGIRITRKFGETVMKH